MGGVDSLILPERRQKNRKIYQFNCNFCKFFKTTKNQNSELINETERDTIFVLISSLVMAASM